MISNIVAKLTGGAPTELPRNWSERRQVLAAKRTSAAALFEREKDVALAHVTAAHECARRRESEIADAETAAVCVLEDELGKRLYGPKSELRAALAGWLENPNRPQAREVMRLLRELDAYTREVLNTRLDTAALSVAWICTLIDSGRDDLISHVGLPLNFSYGAGWLALPATVSSAALQGDGNLPEVEAALSKSERAFGSLLANRYGSPHERARQSWAARTASGTQRAFDARMAALPRKAAGAPLPPLPVVEHEPLPEIA